MLLSRQTFALCVFRSRTSQNLLSPQNHKLPAFFAQAVYPYSTSSKSVTREHKNLPPAQQASLILNPPASTLPPPLSLPTLGTNLSAKEKLKFYYRTGRSYITFYRTGIVALWRNFKVLRQVRLRIPRGFSAEQALRAGVLSRSDYHFLRRTRSDLFRIPFFALVLTICGEFTPLVVIFLGLSGVVPRTCRIPRQIDGAREKAEARRRKSFRDGTISSAGETQDIQNVRKLPRPVILHVGRSLGLYSSLWDKIGVMPTLLLPRRIQKAVERIDVDDFAIEKGGGAKYLSGEELKLAAGERGLDVIGKSRDEIGSVLGMWIGHRKRTSIVDLVCRRPSAWPRV
ncbi:MAG: hypothetical protein Q9176_001234 [Flavoplaca citrina]